MNNAGARIEAAIRAANAAQRPALIPFFTAGYPRREDFSSTLARVAGAADVVEIGVPFTDPMADGVSIQRASRAALEAGVSLRWILDTLAGLDAPPAAPLVLMSYLNPLLAFQPERLAKRALQAHVSGFIVPDLPFEESAGIATALEASNVALIQLVSPLTDAARMAKLCAASRGFVYAVTMTGTTGGDSALPDDLTGYLDCVREVSALPVCAGFGIRSREQVRRIAPHADGVIVGSALVEALERGADPAEFLRGLW